jgi:methyl-accepting chemotaxis protein
MARYVPVKDRQGKIIAVIATAFDFTDSLKSLKEKIRNLKIGQSGYFYALNATEGANAGKLEIHPAKEGSSIFEAKDASGREFIKAMLKQKEGVIRYPWINKELNETSPRDKLVAYRYLKEWNWVVAGGTYLDELSHESQILRIAMFGATFVVVVILILTFMYIARSWITKPLQGAVADTKLLAAGDFGAVSFNESMVQEHSADETVQLSREIRVMACSLKTLLIKITGAADEVSATANQVHATADRIASGSEKVAAQSTTIAVAGEEMSATSGTIAQNCQMAAEGAHRASESAKNGRQVVDKTVLVMGQIAEKVRASAQAVENLGTRSDQIGEIIGTIEDIADQTNLLALNAAIEAARAGEQGRGFAVVADEVRALAVRTTRATSEIGAMIKAIQNETTDAVAAMEQSVRQVEEGTTDAARSGDALSEILEQVDTVAVQVNQIATAAEEQTATISEIAVNMMMITDIVQETSRGAHESAQAAGKLSSNAEELQHLLRQFKL